MKCDFITGEGTCNNMHSDPSGLCFTHRHMPGTTLRDLQSVVNATCLYVEWRKVLVSSVAETGYVKRLCDAVDNMSKRARRGAA